MKLYKFAQAVVVSLLFSLFIFGQDALDNQETSNDQNPKETRKVNEIGQTSECDLSNSLQNIRDGELGADPTAKLYIIVYNGKNVLPSAYDNNKFQRQIRTQMDFLPLDETRVVFVDGGFREEVFAEFFIVPKDGEIPKPSKTVSKPQIPKNKAYLFDKSIFYDSQEFVFDSILANQEAERLKDEQDYAREHPEENVENLPEELPPGVVETETSPEEYEEPKLPAFYWINSRFGEILKGEKTTKGVLIFYADDQYYDLGKVKPEMESGKKHIMAETGISADRIEIIFGGYREEITVEFWVVPNKGKRPKPTPDERKPETPS
jgi:hypothetical protein